MKKWWVIMLTIATTASAQDFTSSAAKAAKSRYEQAVARAQREYAASLKTAFRIAMRSGDLEEATLIKKTGETLQKKLAAPKRGVKQAKIPTTSKELIKYLRGTRWKFDERRTLTLGKDGVVSKSWGNLHPNWSVVDMQLVYEGKTFEFNKDFTVITEITGREFYVPGVLVK